MIKIILAIKKRAKPRGGIGRYGNMTHSANGYREWQDDAIKLIKCLGIPHIESEIYALHIVLYKKGRGDLDNLAGGVMDLMVKAGVIDDDDWNTIPNLFVHTNPKKIDQIDVYFTFTRDETQKIMTDF